MFGTTVNPAPAGAFGGLFLLYVVALWPVFSKAGYPGWYALIPIWNLYILVKIADYSGVWVLGFFIPLVNLWVSGVIALGVGRSFGQSALWSLIGLWIFSPLGYLLIGYGPARYSGPGDDFDL